MSKTNALLKWTGAAAASGIATVALISFYEPLYSLTFKIGFFLFILLTLLFYQKLGRTKRFPITLQKANRKWTLPFVLLFPMILMASSAADQSHIETNIMVGVIYLLAYGTYVFLTLSLMEYIAGIDPKGRTSRFSLLFYIGIPFAAWMLYFIAFFPATMTPDSLSQWGQAHSFEWSNWHPLVHTWVMTVLVQIWDSPGVMSLFQIAVLSVVWGSGMKAIEKRGVSYIGLTLFTIIVAAWPVLGIYSISLWKDVLYSTVLFLFSILMFKIVFSEGTWLHRKRNLFLLFLTSLAVAFFRHNGFPVFLFMGVVLLIVFRKEWKPLLLNFLAVVGIYMIVTGPIFSSLDVRSTETKEAVGIPTQQIANIVINGDLTAEQEEYVASIMPLEDWKKFYHPYKVDPIKFSGYFNDTVIGDDIGKFLSMWAGMVIKNPGLAIEAYLREASIVWQMHEPEPPGYTSNFVTYIYKNNDYGLVNKTIAPDLKTEMKEYLDNSETYFLTTIWRPASYLLAILFLTYTAFIKYGRRGTVWLIALPVLLSVGSVAATLPAQDFRYLFSNVPLALFLMAMVWIPREEKTEIHE